MGYMLQKDYLLEWRSIYKNAILGLEIQKRAHPGKARLCGGAFFTPTVFPVSEIPPLAALRRNAPEGCPDPHPLALKPDLLLLDEPFSALDYQTRLKVSDDIGKILREAKKARHFGDPRHLEAISMATGC